MIIDISLNQLFPRQSIMKTLTWEDFIKSVNNLQKYNEETGDMEDVSPDVIATTLKVAMYLQAVEDIPWDVYVFEDSVFIEWIGQKRLEIEHAYPDTIECTLCTIEDGEYVHTHISVPT